MTSAQSTLRGGTGVGFDDNAEPCAGAELAVEPRVDERAVDCGVTFVALDVTVAFGADCCGVVDDTRVLPS